MSLETTRLKITEFLNTEIINNSFIYLSIWSLVHFFSGLMLGLIFAIIKKPKNKYYRLVIIFLILIIYEIIEYLGYGYFELSWMVTKESFTDVIWDIIIGMTGAIITLLKKDKLFK